MKQWAILIIFSKHPIKLILENRHSGSYDTPQVFF